MAISTLYQSGLQENNRIHFAAIVKMAICDGEINDKERVVLFRLADKLNIDNNAFSEIIHNVDAYPMPSTSSKQERLEYIYDFFKIIFADHELDERELNYVKKYAIGLGCKEEEATRVINKTIKLLGGDIDFEDYTFLIQK